MSLTTKILDKEEINFDELHNGIYSDHLTISWPATPIKEILVEPDFPCEGLLLSIDGLLETNETEEQELLFVALLNRLLPKIRFLQIIAILEIPDTLLTALCEFIEKSKKLESYDQFVYPDKANADLCSAVSKNHSIIAMRREATRYEDILIQNNMQVNKNIIFYKMGGSSRPDKERAAIDWVEKNRKYRYNSLLVLFSRNPKIACIAHLIKHYIQK